MVVYHVVLVMAKGKMKKAERGKGWSKTIDQARKKAVLMLLEKDILGQVAFIYRDKKLCGVVSMQTGPDEYHKPSTGIARGIQFMFDDGNEFFTCFMNGKVKRW